jgi:PmbA protein
MNKEMFELAEWAVKTTKSCGADDCKVSIRSDRSVEIGYRERKPENIKEASTKRLGIQVFKDKKYSSQSTSDLRKDSLKDFIAKAVATTKLLAEDPFRTLPDPKYYQGREKIDLKMADADYKKYSPEDRHKLVKAMEAACLEKGGNKIISVSASVSDSRAESVVLTSNGFDGYRESTSYSAGVSVTMKDEGDRKPNGYNYIGAIMKKNLPKPEDIGIEGAKRTMDLLGAKKIKTMTAPIIIENRAASQLLNGFMQGLYASNIQQKQSFLANKKGEKVGSDKFTLIDDPFIISGFGSRLFDGDGFATKKRTLVENGVVKEFLVDWYYSRKLGWEPTTGGTSNLILPPGTRSVKEIMKDLGKGIYITGFIGGNSNSTTGDASIGIIGTYFENGEMVQPVCEMNVADNHLKFWNKLVETGNDPWLSSSWRLPSLVFNDVVISGL